MSKVIYFLAVIIFTNISYAQSNTDDLKATLDFCHDYYQSKNLEPYRGVGIYPSEFTN